MEKLKGLFPNLKESAVREHKDKPKQSAEDFDQVVLRSLGIQVPWDLVATVLEFKSGSGPTLLCPLHRSLSRSRRPSVARGPSVGASARTERVLELTGERVRLEDYRRYMR